MDKTKFNNESLKNVNSYSNFKKGNKRSNINYDYEFSYELGREYAENSTEKYKNDYDKLNKNSSCRKLKSE